MLKELLVDSNLLNRMSVVPLTPEQQFVCLAFLQLSDCDGEGLLRASDAEVARVLGLNPRCVARIRRTIERNTDLLSAEWIRNRAVGPYCKTKCAEWRWVYDQVSPLGGTWATVHTYVHLLTFARDNVVQWNRRVVRAGMVKQCGRKMPKVKDHLRILRKAGIISRKRGSAIHIVRYGDGARDHSGSEDPVTEKQRGTVRKKVSGTASVPAGLECLLTSTLDVAAATVRSHPGMAYEASLEEKREYNTWAETLNKRLDGITRMSEIAESLPPLDSDPEGKTALLTQKETGIRQIVGDAVYDRMDVYASKNDAVEGLGRDLSQDEVKFLILRKLAIKAITDHYRCYIHNLPAKVEPLPPTPIMTESELRVRTNRLLELWKSVHASVLGSTAVRTAADWKGARMIVHYLNRGYYFPGPYEEQAFQALEIILKKLAEKSRSDNSNFSLSWVYRQLDRGKDSWRPMFDEVFQKLRAQIGAQEQ